MRRASDELVSVVIPAYNAVDYVGDAIDSVLRQTYASREIIVVDDGSTDGTAECLARYGDRIRYVRQANAERAAARNHGLRLARGEYVAFLDADDVWRPSKLAKQVALMRHNPALVFVYGWVDLTDVTLKRLRTVRCGRPLEAAEGGEAFAELVLHNFVTGGASTVLARTGRLRALGGFEPSLRHVEDWDLWLRLAAEGPVGFVPESVALYRAFGVRQAPKQVDLGVRDSYPRVVERALDLPTGRTLPAVCRTEARARAWFYVALLSFSVGDYTRFDRDLARAIELDPTYFAAEGDGGFVDGLVAWSLALRDDWTPLEESLAFIERFVAQVPDAVRGLRSQRARILARLYARFVFQAWAEGRRSEVRRYWLDMMRHDPSWLRNRGTWMMGLRSMLGP